jgi:hypothetical protein
MSSIEIDDVYSVEFRHKVVSENARGLIDGTKSIQIAPWVNDDKTIKLIGGYHGDLMGLAGLYFSNEKLGITRDKLEHKMFQCIIHLRIWDAIQDNATSTTKIESQMAELQKKIDDNNELLTKVMGVLAEVLKRLDSKR